MTATLADLGPHRRPRSSTPAEPPVRVRSSKPRRHGHGRRRVLIEIWSTDPMTKIDIGAWSAKVGHDFLGRLAADGYDRVFVRRGK